jgi:hypothetical protein
MQCLSRSNYRSDFYNKNYRKVRHYGF